MGLGLPDWLGKPVAVFLIDFLLAGDNALVIGMVCAALPARHRRNVLLFGTIGAILSRVILAGIAGTLLGVPFLRLVGGCLLMIFALNMARNDGDVVRDVPALDQRIDLFAAIVLITLTDVLMSLDNILGLAAVAGDSLVYLSIGLLLSVSIMMFASALVTGVLARFPDMARLGAALLGWVAGQLAISDAWFGSWVDTQAPALPLLVPALAALFVWLSGGAAMPRAARAQRTTPRVAASRPPVSGPPKLARAPAAVVAARAAPPPRRTSAPDPAVPPDMEAPDLETVGAAGADRSLLLLLLALFLVGSVILSGVTIYAGVIDF